MTPEQISEMLSCPFCGELPDYQPAAKDPNNPPYGWPHQIVHFCKVLGHQICVRAHTANLPDTKESVFKLWNTRAITNLLKAYAECVEALRESQVWLGHQIDQDNTKVHLMAPYLTATKALSTLTTTLKELEGK